MPLVMYSGLSEAAEQEPPRHVGDATQRGPADEQGEEAEQRGRDPQLQRRRSVGRADRPG